MAQTIFISYRRTDSAGLTRALYDRLTAALPSDDIFLDVETIAGGEDFVASVAQAITSADVLLVMIGPDWVSVSNEAGRRLDNPADLVRVEVATALANEVRVVPVLLDGAAMPQADQLPTDLDGLTTRNAVEVRTTRFDADAAALIKTLSGVRAGAVAGLAAVAVLSLVGAVLLIALAQPTAAFYGAIVVLSATAAFASRRALGDYARFAGRRASVALTAVTPLVLFAGLLLSGMTFNRVARAGQPFTLAVEATASAASERELGGEVTLATSVGTWDARLGPDGRAVFTDLPAAALGRDATVSVAAEGFERAHVGATLADNAVVRLELTPLEVSSDVRGTVLDAASNPVAGVVVDFASGLATDTTDAQGNFRVVLPIAAGDRTALLATLDGQVGYRDLVLVPSGTPLTIPFRPTTP